MSRMTRSVKRVMAVSTLSAVAVGMLAACGSGSPQSGGTSTNGATSSTTTASSSAGASDRWFNSVQACSMIDQATLAQLGFTSPGTVATNTASENRCKWRNDTGTIDIDMTDNVYNTLYAAAGEQLSNLTVAGRPAQQDDISSGGTCDISLEATPGSRALIIAVTLEQTPGLACSMAKQAATAVVPKLPKLSS